MEVEVENGWIICIVFFLVVMISNGERDFFVFFLWWCLFLRMKFLIKEELIRIVIVYFN